MQGKAALQEHFALQVPIDDDLDIIADLGSYPPIPSQGELCLQLPNFC